MDEYITKIKEGLKECLEELENFYCNDIGFGKFHSREDAIRCFKDNYSHLIELVK